MRKKIKTNIDLVNIVNDLIYHFNILKSSLTIIASYFVNTNRVGQLGHGKMIFEHATN